MTTSTVAPEIIEFARGVRAALADLSAEEVDDLTEGLEADLAESLAEDLRRTLPDPVVYADELRLAAGLPAPTIVVKRGVLSGLADGLRETETAIVEAVRRNPAAAAVLDFLRVLAPAWWVVRAWLAAWLSAAFFGMENGYWFEGVWWLVLVIFVVVSVQWARGRWTFTGLGSLIVVGNVIAVVALLPVLGAAAAQGDRVYYSYDEPAQDLTGVYLNGTQVTNIFGYNADGKPLSGVQLFDQDGRPVATSVPGGNGCLDADCAKVGLWAPSALQNGTVAWNVFPMKMVEAGDPETGDGTTALPGAEPLERPAPFAQVPALVAPKKVAKSD